MRGTYRERASVAIALTRLVSSPSRARSYGAIAINLLDVKDVSRCDLFEL